MKYGEKWCALTREEIAEKLNTDLFLGLSKGEARKRSARLGKNTFFLRRSSRKASVVLRPFGAVSSALILLCSFLGLFFGVFNVAIASLIAFFLVIATLVSFSLIYEGGVLRQSGLSMPMVRVKRDGVVYTTNADNVTVGDVIVLKAGDVVPADARLVFGEGLIVDTYTGTSERGFSYRRDTKDPDEHYDYGASVNPPDEKNMIYGGSYVYRGKAEAVVVGVGDNTHVGAILGGVLLDRSPKNKRSRIDEYVKYSEMAFLLIAVPVSLIGALALKKDGLYLSVTLALSLAFANCGFVLSSFALKLKGKAFSEMNSSSGGKLIVKNQSALDDAAALTDVFLLERYALTDGSYIAREFYTVGANYSAEDMLSERLDTLFECAYITEVMSSHDSDLCDAVSEIAVIRTYDTQAAKIRLKGASSRVISINGVEFLALDGALEDGQVSFSVCEDARGLDLCRYYVGPAGEILLMDNSSRRDAMAFWERSKSSGCRVRIYFKMTADAPVFIGMAAFAQRMFDGVREVVSSAEKLGLKVVFFSEKEDFATLSYFRESGVISDSVAPVLASSVTKDGKTLFDVYGRGKAFFGFSKKEIYELQLYLKKKNHRIAVLAVASDELPLVRAADMSFAFDMIDYPSTKLQDAVFDSLPEDGAKNSPRSSQSVKLESDALIKRSGEDSSAGPVSAVLKLIRTSRSLIWKEALMLSYFIPMQVLRGVFVALSIVFGLSSFSPFSVLVFGALLDVLVFWTLGTYRRIDVRSFKRSREAICDPLKFSARRVSVAFAFAVVAFVFTFVSSLFVPAAEGAFSCLCTMLCSFILAFLTIREWGAKNPFCAVIPVRLILTLCSFGVAIAVSFIPRVDSIIRMDGIASAYWILSLACMPVLLVGLYLLYPRILKKINK